jgi:hypothetical protein
MLEVPMNNRAPRTIVILGPTTVGKTDVAFGLARRVGAAHAILAAYEQEPFHLGPRIASQLQIKDQTIDFGYCGFPALWCQGPPRGPEVACQGIVQSPVHR